MEKITYDKICLMLPTYKRVGGLMAFCDSALKKANDPSRIRFGLCVNEKDQETLAYINQRYWPSDDCFDVVLENTRQPNLSFYFNEIYKRTRFKEPGTLVSQLGDDMVFYTKGWDERVLDETNRREGKAVVYCDDNYIAHDKCCVNFFTTRLMVEAQRKPFMCEFFHADMIDMIWTMVGAMTGTLAYLPDVVIQHNHSTKVEKEKWDETYQRLAPVQKAANGRDNQKYAAAYATLCAKNLIEGGIGQWNVLR